MAPDAMDIKESLAAQHVKAPVPPKGATPEERLKEAQGHVKALAKKTEPVTLAAKDDPGNTSLTGNLAVQHGTASAASNSTLRRDPRGHMVEEHRLPGTSREVPPKA